MNPGVSRQEKACNAMRTRSGRTIQRDVKDAIRSTFGAKVVEGAAKLQKEKEKKPITVARKRSRVEEEKCVKAGLDRVGPNTPIGKIKQRLARATREGAASTATAVEVATAVDTDEVLHDALAQVKLIYATKGIVATRKHLDMLPSRKNFNGCKGKLTYWTSYIDVEREEKEWGRVAELFERARVSISGGVELEALQSMFECFEQETNYLYEEERQKLDQSVLETLSDSEDLVSVMAGRKCTNDAPKSVVAPAPKTLHFLEETSTAVQPKKKPRMRF